MPEDREPATRPTDSTAVLLPPLPRPPLHGTLESELHLVASHAVIPTLPDADTHAIPPCAPCTAIVTEPLLAPLPRAATLSATLSADSMLVLEPARSDAVTTTPLLLPSPPPDARQTIAVSALHALAAHAVSPSRGVRDSDACPMC